MWVKSGELSINLENVVFLENFSYNEGHAELRAYVPASDAEGLIPFMVILEGNAATVSRAHRAILDAAVTGQRAFDLDIWLKKRTQVLRETKVELSTVEEVGS